MEKKRWPLFIHVTIGIVLAFSIVAVVNIGIIVALAKSFTKSVTEFLTPLDYKAQKSIPVQQLKNWHSSPLNISIPQPIQLPNIAENKQNDYPPEDHPSKWDYIESANKKCWFHKTTREKICTDK